MLFLRPRPAPAGAGHACTPRRVTVVVSASATGDTPREIRVCTHTTCRKQGSPTILKLARDLSLPGVTVSETGCLGGCGAGPNVALLGGDVAVAAGVPGVVANHVATAGALFGALRDAGLADVSPSLQTATAARLAGNEAARRGAFDDAVEQYTRGLEAAEGDDAARRAATHLLLANRSGAKLAAGDAAGAATDADDAVEAAPPGWSTARVRQVEARRALGDQGGVARALAGLESACGDEGRQLVRQLASVKVG